MKAVVLIVGVLTGAMFFTSLIVTTRLTGTLNPAETVKLIGEPYEESSDFSNTVESYMLQVLEQFQLKTLFESDGAYNPDTSEQPIIIMHRKQRIPSLTRIRKNRFSLSLKRKE